jgi:Bacterial pre-peptidase C-terminal domain
MLNNSLGNAIASRAADDRQGGARALGQLNGSRVFRGAVGAGDKADFYSFTLSGRSSFNLSLNKLKNNVDVFLQQGKQVVARSTKGGKKPETISTTLEAGTYYVRVNQKSGNSKYKLTLNATPASNPGGTIPDPPNLPARNRLVSSGRRGGEKGSSLGFIDLNTGILTLLPTSGSGTSLPWDDIAVFGNEGYFLSLGSVGSKFDLTTGVAPLTPNNITDIDLYGLEFTPSGELYATSALRSLRPGQDYVGGLYKIDITNQKANLVAEIPGFNGVGDLVFNPASGRFFAASRNPQDGFYQLYSIGLSGDAALIGNIGYDLLGAMVFDNGTLYGFTRNEQIVINTTTGAGTFDKMVTLPNESFVPYITGGS